MNPPQSPQAQALDTQSRETQTREIQAKIRVLGGVQIVLGYGKDLRSGRNSFFTTVTK